MWGSCSCSFLFQFASHNSMWFPGWNWWHHSPATWWDYSIGMCYSINVIMVSELELFRTKALDKFKLLSFWYYLDRHFTKYSHFQDSSSDACKYSLAFTEWCFDISLGKQWGSLGCVWPNSVSSANWKSLQAFVLWHQNETQSIWRQTFHGRESLVGFPLLSSNEMNSFGQCVFVHLIQDQCSNSRNHQTFYIRT